jgi:hypothetical protein
MAAEDIAGREHAERLAIVWVNADRLFQQRLRNEIRAMLEFG